MSQMTMLSQVPFVSFLCATKIVNHNDELEYIVMGFRLLGTLIDKLNFKTKKFELTSSILSRLFRISSSKFACSVSLFKF
jgi:hypothetical protein